MLKQEILETIKREKLIVIVRGVSTEKLFPLCEALYAGGVRLVECTFDMKGKETVAKTAKKIEDLGRAFEGRMLIGAGTVMTEEQSEAAYRAGAKYLISPHTDETIIAYANEHGMASIPGAMTPTEIVRAYRAGADFVKVFPNDIMGLAYLKSIRAPLSAIPMLAVGGVNAENVGDYLAAGVDGVGVGSGLVKKQWIEEGNWGAITAQAREMTDAIRA